MEIEGKEGWGFFIPPEKKTRKKKRLFLDEEAFEPADILWNDDEIPDENEEGPSDLPEEEDEPLPL